MKRASWLHELGATLGNTVKYHVRGRKRRPLSTRRPRFEPLEGRTPLALLAVNSPLDNNIPGDGLVTLREAIIAANANSTTDLGHTGSGADTIQFDPAIFSTPRTLSLAFGEMTITQALTINGPDQSLLTIDAQQNSRIFNITATSGDFRINDLSLTNGRVIGTNSASGGAISMDGQGISLWSGSTSRPAALLLETMHSIRRAGALSQCDPGHSPLFRAPSAATVPPRRRHKAAESHPSVEPCAFSTASSAIIRHAQVVGFMFTTLIRN